MDLDTLKLFLHLCRSLHFSKTSQACNISAPGLTRAIQRLEQETGERLFERDNRSVSLTPTGVLFQKYAENMVAAWQEFTDMKSRTPGEVYGELRLYCSVTASYMILKQLLSDYRKAYPGVQIYIQTGEAEAAVRQVMDGSADISIAARPDSLSRRIDFKTVTMTPLVFIAGKDFKYESADTAPFILPAHGPSRKRIEQWFDKKKISPPIYAEVSGNEAIIAMASLGFGVGVVPGLVLDQSSLKKDIKILPLAPELKGYEVGYCCPHRKNRKAAVNAFWNMIPENI
ncbi:MAG: HTH-type transcriptional activator IlvY [Desulfobacteraceae bacterium]|jgi:LysR family positive regulator for ilvC